ncbi:hypothetical protein T02_1491 [Trichinella nativa]|uniref:Uncharacterized protein n=1 Tax=Trichinella nativa TaxID=6335 RepID=A0A0V1KJJ9_9BILA|nr:hypothetical protein T02_1491 [Trichinella nativa]
MKFCNFQEKPCNPKMDLMEKDFSQIFAKKVSPRNFAIFEKTAFLENQLKSTLTDLKRF